MCKNQLRMNIIFRERYIKKYNEALKSLTNETEYEEIRGRIRDTQNYIKTLTIQLGDGDLEKGEEDMKKTKIYLGED